MSNVHKEHPIEERHLKILEKFRLPVPYVWEVLITSGSSFIFHIVLEHKQLKGEKIFYFVTNGTEKIIRLSGVSHHLRTVQRAVFPHLLDKYHLWCLGNYGCLNILSFGQN